MAIRSKASPSAPDLRMRRAISTHSSDSPAAEKYSTLESGSPSGATVSANRHRRTRSSVWLSEPRLSDPRLSEPRLSDPRLSKPRLSDPRLSDPRLSDPRLSEPRLSDPRLSEPRPSRS